MRSFTTIRDSFHGQLNKECNLKKLVTLSNVTLPYSKTDNCSEILKLCALCNYSRLNTYLRSMFSRVSIPNTLPIEKTSTNTSFELSRMMEAIPVSYTFIPRNSYHVSFSHQKMEGFVLVCTSSSSLKASVLGTTNRNSPQTVG